MESSDGSLSIPGLPLETNYRSKSRRRVPVKETENKTKGEEWVLPECCLRLDELFHTVRIVHSCPVCPR